MAVKYIQINKPADLAKLILFYRKKSSLSRQQLGVLAGVGKNAIFAIEHGKNTFQIDTLLKILVVLNLKLHVEGPFNGDLQ